MLLPWVGQGWQERTTSERAGWDVSQPGTTRTAVRDGLQGALCLCFSHSGSNCWKEPEKRLNPTTLRGAEQRDTQGSASETGALEEKRRAMSEGVPRKSRADAHRTAPQRPARRHRLRPPAEHVHRPPQRHLSEERTIRAQGGTGHGLHWHFPSLTGFLSRWERALSPQRFRSPFSPQSGRSESRGARQAPRRRACSADICREAGFGHLKPRQKKNQRLPEVRAPSGSSCVRFWKEPSLNLLPSKFPITARALTHQQLPFLRGIHTSSQELVSPRFTRCEPRGWPQQRLGVHLPCPSGQAEPQHALPASAPAALRCHTSVLLFSNNSPTGGFAEQDALQGALEELVSPPPTTALDMISASCVQREEPCSAI